MLLILRESLKRQEWNYQLRDGLQWEKEEENELSIKLNLKVQACFKNIIFPDLLYCFQLQVFPFQPSDLTSDPSNYLAPDQMRTQIIEKTSRVVISWTAKLFSTGI